MSKDTKTIANAVEVKEKKVVMFCANDQEQMPHSLDVDGNGEILLTCDSCKRVIKLPADMDAAGISAYIEKHNAANEGQRSNESLKVRREEILESLGEVILDEQPVDPKKDPQK